MFNNAELTKDASRTVKKLLSSHTKDDQKNNIDMYIKRDWYQPKRFDRITMKHNYLCDICNAEALANRLDYKLTCLYCNVTVIIHFINLHQYLPKLSFKNN